MVRASFFRQVCHRSALTEIAWEDVVQGLGMAKKIGNCCLSATCFTNSDISACCFTSMLRARTPSGAHAPASLKLQIARSQIFSMDFPYDLSFGSSSERRKWSLGLGQHLKGAWPNVRTELRSQSSREIKKRNHK